MPRDLGWSCVCANKRSLSDATDTLYFDVTRWRHPIRRALCYHTSGQRSTAHHQRMRSSCNAPQLQRYSAQWTQMRSISCGSLFEVTQTLNHRSSHTRTYSDKQQRRDKACPASVLHHHRRLALKIPPSPPTTDSLPQTLFSMTQNIRFSRCPTKASAYTSCHLLWLNARFTAWEAMQPRLFTTPDICKASQNRIKARSSHTLSPKTARTQEPPERSSPATAGTRIACARIGKMK